MTRHGKNYAEHIVDIVTLILDNDETWQPRLFKAACEAVRTFDPCATEENQREWFASALRGNGAFGYQLRDYAQAAGTAIREVLEEMMSEFNDGGLCYRLLRELIDPSDRVLIDMFAEHYLPGRIEDAFCEEEEPECGCSNPHCD